MNEVYYRELRDEESQLFEEFLYQAIFLPEGTDPPERSVIHEPELFLYIDGFGQEKDDHHLAAETDGRIVGIVWCRIMNDYGHVDQDTPSLAFSLLPSYRNRGIGTELLDRFINLLKKRGYDQLSLSVQKENYAVRMYLKAGFKIIQETDEEYIMILKFNEKDLGEIK